MKLRSAEFPTTDKMVCLFFLKKLGLRERQMSACNVSRSRFLLNHGDEWILHIFAADIRTEMPVNRSDGTKM